MNGCHLLGLWLLGVRMNKANRMHINQTADHCMKYESYLWHDDRAFAGIIVVVVVATINK